MAIISQTTFSSALSWMKMYEFVQKDPIINYIQILVQMMAWRRTDRKSLSEPMVA